MALSTSRYDKLLATYEDLVAEISGVQDPLVSGFCSSWESTRKGYEQALQSGATKSQIASGMEQGLRELPMLFREAADKQSSQLLNILHIAVVKNFPEFFRKDALLLASIVERGKIRNAREYYLVRHRIDELEGEASSPGECQLLYKLVEQFER
jgi:hypothetical protein